MSSRALTEAEWDADYRRELRENLAEVERTMRPQAPTSPVTPLRLSTVPPSRLMTVEQAAKHLAVSPGLVRRWVVNGNLKRVELPDAHGSGRRARVLRVDARDLDKLIESSKA